MKLGFDHDKYISEQSKYILERVSRWDKLYLEFGGKLMFDAHAKRCLPGYRENAKLELLATLREKAEIIICVYSGDIERSKARSDSGITYGMDVFRLIDDLRLYGLSVNSVVITRYETHPATEAFISKLNNRGIITYKHKSIDGYPTNVDRIVSDSGYGSNEFIETTKPLVVVTAPGPGSGKLATVLGQMYHEKKRGTRAGYAKFETFPVWNIPLSHPLNVAYEAATADLKDFNMIDSYHMESYGVTSINYNRDMEMFPVVKRILERITGCDSIYKSPTDMGVNMIASGIIDDEAVRQASSQEVIRRYFVAACEYKQGVGSAEECERLKILLDKLSLTPEDRSVVVPTREYLAHARERLNKVDGIAAVGIELPDGKIATGRNSELMTACAAAVLNAVKVLANLPDEVHFLPPIIIEPIVRLKREILNERYNVLSAEDILIALSISAVTNPLAQTAVSKLGELAGCKAHSSCFLTDADASMYRCLGIDITCDSEYLNQSLYYLT